MTSRPPSTTVEGMETDTAEVQDVTPGECMEYVEAHMLEPGNTVWTGPDRDDYAEVYQVTRTKNRVQIYVIREANNIAPPLCVYNGPSWLAIPWRQPEESAS